MLELPFPEHLPGSIEHARLMLLRSPVDTREPGQLHNNLPCLMKSNGRAPMPADGALYWRSTAHTPHLGIHRWLDRRGTSPCQVL